VRRKHTDFEEAVRIDQSDHAFARRQFPGFPVLVQFVRAAPQHRPFAALDQSVDFLLNVRCRCHDEAFLYAGATATPCALPFLSTL
jgi:hypothetical protein